MELLHCNIVIMKPSEPKILRLNLKRNSRIYEIPCVLAVQHAAATVQDLLRGVESPNEFAHVVSISAIARNGYPRLKASTPTSSPEEIMTYQSYGGRLLELDLLQDYLTCEAQRNWLESAFNTSISLGRVLEQYQISDALSMSPTFASAKSRQSEFRGSSSGARGYSNHTRKEPGEQILHVQLDLIWMGTHGVVLIDIVQQFIIQRPHRIASVPKLCGRTRGG